MVYKYHSSPIHSSADGHLGCFHVLAIINSDSLTSKASGSNFVYFRRGIRREGEGKRKEEREGWRERMRKEEIEIKSCNTD